ncbi:diguanylate cyclase (GGDEF)-like protein [Paraburkholderia fungorum]|uniref:Diguanylate cyclase (GGDEF)-like protein n=2 Tax=Paraburkholderia fungorum TaxID=134537 RepID=A0AAW3V7H3_9BURK|nr:EAL domain-containing protein [Paraburkholderia fungorum]MBB4519325.1 diguanylate cyclase (GGDEF)-like protein [Paraburkholderia fungorum]MBB6206291.1 diguanylate cyclase (GGDEF)-like protein [Paraburkholderia fungorum]
MVALSFPVIPDPSATLSPAAAIARLRDAAPTARFSTHLAETPFWFMLTAPALGGEGPTLIDLPSRHAQTLSCWRTGPVPTPLGAADRHGTSGEMRANKAGFALRLDEHAAQMQILCRGTFSGPAYITASATNAEELEVSALDFTQSASLITGGLLTLAIFVFVTAIINREWTYVIFAAWLVGNLRLSANAMGFDTEWMGWLIPPDHIALLREFTFASYYVLTTTLFVELFRRELKTIGLRWSLHAVRYGGCLLMIAACTLSYAHFIPVLWACASFCILVLTYFLVQLFIKARSRTVLWYVASMGIVLFATLSQVLAAALGVKALAGALSPVVTALSSSMLCAFAIAERMREERERRRQMQIELRNTYDVTPIGLFTLSGDSAFLRANPALHSMLGLPQQHHGAHRWADYFAPGAERALAELLERDDSASIEIEGTAGTKTEARRYSLRAIRANGFIEGSLEDVTDRSKAVERLHFLAEHDPLTGLLNRRGIEHAIGRQSGESGPWALAYLDLDRFKLLNDLFGHGTGDEILRHVAARLVERLGSDVPIGRIGGDEFVCVLVNMEIDDAVARCRELVSALNSAPVHVDTRAFQIRGSVGVVECSQGERVLDALAYADRACRAAKRGGNARLVALRKGAPAFEERAAEISLIEALGQSRLPEGLFLVMQPIMSMRAPTEALDFEVLLRLRMPDGSVATAAKLIAAAEDSGTITAIDRWVLSTTLAWLRDNRASLSTTRFVCVNLSGGSLNDEQFLDELFELFSRHEDVIHYLCVEITESVALHDLEHTERFIARVHDMGAKIAIDDFGAGQTSLRYLKKLSADALKIDGEFVRTMCNHPADVAIVEAIISLARNLGMRSIAEWVEDLETLHALNELGVDYVQGFAIAKPQEAEDILTASSAASFVTNTDLTRYLNARQTQRGGADEQRMERESAA